MPAFVRLQMISKLDWTAVASERIKIQYLSLSKSFYLTRDDGDV